MLHSVGGAAVCASVVELLLRDDLARTVAEPRALASTTTTEQQLTTVLAACMARDRSWRQRCQFHARLGGARPGSGRQARCCHLDLTVRVGAL